MHQETIDKKTIVVVIAFLGHNDKRFGGTCLIYDHPFIS